MNTKNKSTEKTIATLSRLKSIWKCLMITALILIVSLVSLGSYMFYNQQTYTDLSVEISTSDDTISSNFIDPKTDLLDRGPMAPTSPIPVDVVYTWVNGSDPEFVKLLQRLKHETFPVPIRGEAKNANRFREQDQLKYSIRSIAKYAPWTNHIYIVTNGQVPSWLNLTHPKISVITHSQIFSNPSKNLPNFNSFAIESNLHKIPNLATNFIYLNDDFVFLRPTQVYDFINPETNTYNVWLQSNVGWLHLNSTGKPVPTRKLLTLLDPSPSPVGSPKPRNYNLFEWSIRNANSLLGDQPPNSGRVHTPHMPHIFNKHLMHQIEMKFHENFTEIDTHMFRNEKDFLMDYLYYYYLLERDCSSLKGQDCSEIFSKCLDWNKNDIFDWNEIEFLKIRTLDLAGKRILSELGEDFKDKNIESPCDSEKIKNSIDLLPDLSYNAFAKKLPRDLYLFCILTKKSCTEEFIQKIKDQLPIWITLNDDFGNNEDIAADNCMSMMKKEILDWRLGEPSPYELADTV